MARRTRWERAQGAFEDFNQFTVAAVPLAFLQPGETLTRVRFQFSFNAGGKNRTFFTDGLPYVAALQLYPATASSPTTSPITSPNDDWIWWEGFAVTTTGLTINSANGDIFSMASGPHDPDTRDGKAQRVNLDAADQRLWLQIESQLKTDQALIRGSFSASTLILLAP